VEDELDVATPEITPATLRGRETILLVEDEEQVRAVAGNVLRRQGYRVLSAQSPGEALLLSENEATSIDLLLTDVTLPGELTGPRIAETLLKQRPDLPVVFASGYSREMIDLGARTGTALRFLPKPYDRRSLAVAVRDALQNRPARSR
jgi:DNA-binding NtrC family response regulator